MLRYDVSIKPKSIQQSFFSKKPYWITSLLPIPFIFSTEHLSLIKKWNILALYIKICKTCMHTNMEKAELVLQ